MSRYHVLLEDGLGRDGVFCAVLGLPGTVLHVFGVVGIGHYWTEALLCRVRSDMPHVIGQYCFSERRRQVFFIVDW